MPFPPTDKSMAGLLGDTLERLTLVERRLAVGGSGSATPYDAEPGMVMPFTGTTIPEGWLLCDGSTVSRVTYSALFAVVGTTYGAGDGSTTFGLPNYKGRVLVGQDAAQAEFQVLGGMSGEKSHVLTIPEMPNHQHIEGWAGVNPAASYGVAASAPTGNINSQSGQNTAYHAMSSLVGGGGAHNNLQPYAVTRYIISTGAGVGGGSAARASGGGSYTAQAGLISPFAGATAPAGWLVCDGRAVSRGGYPELFSVIGVTYGAGDGSSTFNLPNLKGRVTVGADAAQTEFDVLGETGGQKWHRHDFRFALFDNRWTPQGPNAAMEGGGAGPNNRAGAFKYSTNEYQGAGAGLTVTDTGNSNVLAGSGVQNSSFTRMESLGDTDIPSGTTGLPPYVVTNYIISTGSGVAGGGSSVPALPNPATKHATADAYTITQGAGVWADVPGVTHTFTLANPLWVSVDFGAQFSTTDSSVYGMLGVAASGALTLDPTTDQTSGATSKFAFAPYSMATVSIPGRGKKMILLPVGSTTLTVQSRRNGTAGTQGISYIDMIVTPLYWVGAPGGMQAPGGMVGVMAKSVTVDQGSAVAVGHKVTFNGVGRVSLNGILDSSVAEDYVIECIITSPTNGGWLRMRKAGVDTVTPTYGNQETYNNTATAVATAYAASNGWGFGVAGQHEKFTAKISAAPAASGYCYLDMSTVVQQSGFITNGTNKGTHAAAGYDGFSIQAASGTISGWLRVYALT